MHITEPLLPLGISDAALQCRLLTTPEAPAPLQTAMLFQGYVCIQMYNPLCRCCNFELSC